MDSHRRIAGTTSPVTVADIREAIGGLVILWSQAEAEFRDAVQSLDPSAKACFGSQVVASWATLYTARVTRSDHLATADRFLKRIDAARQVRNGICHSFEGFSADPFGHGHPAELVFRAGEKTVALPYAALRRILTDLATVGMTLSRLTAAARDPANPANGDLLALVEADLDRITAEHPAPDCAFLPP